MEVPAVLCLTPCSCRPFVPRFHVMYNSVNAPYRMCAACVSVCSMFRSTRGLWYGVNTYRLPLTGQRIFTVGGPREISRHEHPGGTTSRASEAAPRVPYGHVCPYHRQSERKNPIRNRYVFHYATACRKKMAASVVGKNSRHIIIPNRPLDREQCICLRSLLRLSSSLLISLPKPGSPVARYVFVALVVS